MMREGIHDLSKGLNYYLAANNPLDLYRELWSSLKLIDQLVIKEVILRGIPVYHKDTYALIEKKLGVDKITRGIVQASMNRMRDQGILNNEGHGQWALESSEFKDYVLTELK